MAMCILRAACLLLPAAQVWEFFFLKMNKEAAQTGHKRQATKTGRHVVTQGSLGDGGVLRRRGEPELGRNLFRRRELQRD